MVSLGTKTTIACLPVAGPGNPYQRLMMEGLNHSERLHAFNGVHDRFFGIVRTLLKYRPAYIHFDWLVSYYYRRWSWLTYASVVAFCAQILLVRLMGVKLVWTLHNLLPHDLTELPLHRFCQRFLARRCEWVRVFGESTVPRAAAELQLLHEQFRVVPEGDYTGVYPNYVTKKKARERLGLPQQGKVLLYLGLIKPYKGVLELLRAFHQVRLQDTYLYLAGKIMDISYGEQIKRELTERVFLNDAFIDGEELQYYFNAADVVVLPFQKIENSGSVILAMGFAKPIVAPAIGVVKERLSQQSALLYNSEEELLGKIQKALCWSQEELQREGLKNKASLEFARWEDFSYLFL